MKKSQGKNFNTLRTKKAFEVKKSIFLSFLNSFQLPDCIKPEIAPLNKKVKWLCIPAIEAILLKYTKIKNCIFRHAN